MRYLSHTEEDIQRMLETIGIKDIDSLFKSIPKALRLQEELKIPDAMDELTLKSFFENKTMLSNKTCFLGAGLYKHFVPVVVTQLLSRGEWLTAYTPYQAEASQGTLQSIFEFQTVVANIYGSDIANASIYDASTALVEAILMTLRVTRKKSVIIPKNINPGYRDVCFTYSEMCEFNIIEVPYNDSTGCIDIDNFEQVLKINKDIGSLVYQFPNFFGCLENQKEVIDTAHKYKTLAIAVNPDPLVFGITEPPGLLGADVVVGEGIGLCPFTGMGSPGLGLFATKKKFTRSLPGRLVGMTRDINRKRSFVLTLATREQHIRRDRATSNICSNNNLNALAFLITVSLYGKKGFFDMAQDNLLRNIYFRKSLKNSQRVKIKYGKHFFNETLLEFNNIRAMNKFIKVMQDNNIVPGLDLNPLFSKLNKHLLVCITELNTIGEIDLMIKELI